MPNTNYPHGFNDGLVVQEIPLFTTQSKDGKVFHVDSNKANAANLGKGTFQSPFATIAYAVSRCTANQGDMIIVAAGHAESVIAAGTLTINVAGVTIKFMGEETNRGTVTFSTDVDASMIVSAANVKIEGARFVSGIDALTGPISITGANCQLINCRWEDAAAKAATDCIIAAATATGLIINGWRYIVSTTGTQKQSHIQLNGVDNAILKNIDISGDFATGNIENITDELLNIRLENIKLKNANATPKPGIVLDADSTGMAKNIDIRIVSGTTYVSSAAKLNWDDQCLGYNNDGYGGDPIGLVHGGSIEAKIDLIQADVGDATARTNFPSLTTMIGVPDAANSSLDDMIRSGFDSTAIVPGADGSVMERLEVIQAALASPQGDLFKIGTCDAGMVASQTSIVAADLAGSGDDFYNSKYYMIVIRNDNSHGAAPETEIRQITDYASATGTFTVNAFSVNVEAADKIAVVSNVLIAGTSPAGTIVNTINTNVGDASGDTLTSIVAKLGDGATTVTADLATANTNLGDASGDTLTSVVAKLGDGATTVTADLGTLKTNVGDPSGDTLTSLTAKVGNNTTALSTTLGDASGDTLTSIVAKLGDGATTVAADLGTLKSDLGDPSGHTLTSITAKIGDIPVTLGATLGNAAGDTLTSIVAKLGNGATTVYSEISKLDTATLAVSPAAGSLARFVATGGTALGTQLADSKSLIDALGTNGTTAAAATAATAASLFGAIGTNEADVTTPFDSTNVQANADGTVLEREEYIQGYVHKLDTATLAVNPAAGSLARFVATGGTALGTQLADSKSLVDAIGSNGTTLVYGSGSALGAIGTTFWIKKTMVSSAILEASDVDITGVSSGGELAIEDVIVKTDGTGLATGTNFELKSNNAKGLENIFVETVANLGASKTVDMDSATVTGIRTVLESGAKLQVHSTVAACDGAGTIDIYVKFRRLSAGATVAPL